MASELVERTAPYPVVAARVDFWRPLAEDQGRDLRLHGAPGTRPVPLSDDDLRELVDTLLDNVFAHTPEGTDIRVTVAPGIRGVDVVVEDAGPGMTLPWRGRGHSAGGGTGLGLAIVHRLAEQADATVELGESDLGGLRVRVALPTADRD